MKRYFYVLKLVKFQKFGTSFEKLYGENYLMQLLAGADSAGGSQRVN